MPLFRQEIRSYEESWWLTDPVIRFYFLWGPGGICWQFGWFLQLFSGIFRGPQWWDPFPILFPYHSQSQSRIPKDMGIGWEAYHNGGPPWICREYFLAFAHDCIHSWSPALVTVYVCFLPRLASQHHCVFFGSYSTSIRSVPLLQQSRNHLQQSRNHEWFDDDFFIKSLVHVFDDFSGPTFLAEYLR